MVGWQAGVTGEVPFHDVDSMSIVWHGHYFKYFELARTALMRQLNYDTPEMIASGYSWPVVESHCQYRHPLRLGQSFEVRAEVSGYESRLEISYQIHSAGQLVAKGFTAQAAVAMPAAELCLVTPEVLRRALGVL
ncbi:MAG: thioesterase family protein [bacterium]|nr:thioesterase family protein [bacterium]